MLNAEEKYRFTITKTNAPIKPTKKPTQLKYRAALCK
jgi:hypothetical protein